MPSPTSALSFATKAPASAPSGSGVAANDDASAAKKPAFDDMVRRPAKRDDAPRTPETRANGAKEPVRQRADTAARKQDDTTRTKGDDDKPEDTDAAPAAPPTLLELPPILAALPTDATAPALTDPLGNPLLGGAQPAAGTATPDALLSGARAALSALPGALGAAPAIASPEAGDAAQPATTDATSSLPTAAAAASDSKAPLQNLLSFAAHLASGQVAAAVPDAINLGRDLVDAFRNEDGDAAPTTNVLAGVGASNGSLGLSRTETVNAMEAPSADLQGGHFDEDIGDAVRWMADQKIGHAHIKVTPNELGTVEIRLRLEGDRVHADFASAQADVRQALESSLPRLRDMLGQHGFQLAHADVGQQHAPPSQGGGSHAGDGSGDAGEPASEAPRSVRMTARGLVDAYA
ncbi:flagellar hook-length control protein FliK [Pseudoxanthomonas sp. PXM02]|uniref:flagellar hook-length control protein FliK n=1 Tax=Pseudoxanthomonas sp. PXM02 TaxID=2769294 RepID=UPI00178772A3|nr:flagellar hook-length control protein FliK [Pseudoxanthomonas sp. PXM02]MBD9481112.1 flagellar hook-length control protein FliK [Pseudoxanthomonas sp. PXM02]